MRKFLGILISVILIFAIIATLILLYSTISLEYKVSNSIQLVSAFSALLTALIALLISYPKTKKLSLKIDLIIDDENIEEYDVSKFNDLLKERFKDFKDPLKSKRVIFKLRNDSDFDIKKPIFTFRLPSICAHPNEKNEVLQFRSNIFNSQRELYLLETSDHQILSNNILPYLNKGDEIELWVRMILDENLVKENEITLFVNCENADGFSQKFSLYKIV
jgi:hypothetical protein